MGRADSHSAGARPGTVLDELFDNNLAWANAKHAADPTFFRRLAEQSGAPLPLGGLLRQPGAGQ